MNTPATKCALVVDDDVACRRLLARILTRHGYQVATAADGVDALAQVHELQPSLIITDWSMPRMDGLELIGALRAEELSWYPYIILVTANNDQQVSLERGADDYVIKPIQIKHLVPRIHAAERIIGLQNTLRERNDRLNEVNRQLSLLAVTDPLTGLLNRRSFFDEAAQEWERCQRYDLPLSCLMLDIDHFKTINDTYGHPVGDMVIRRLATTLAHLSRSTDILCRYGGEEFCILLTNTDGDGAALLAERIRAGISDLLLPEISVDFRLTVSCGLSTRALDVLSEETLVGQADRALLIAKRTGRNCVVRHDEIEHSSSLMSAAEVKPEDIGRDEETAIPYQVVNTLLTALRHRDESTVVHSRRVAQLCRDFARYLGLCPKLRMTLEIAALLHDIGKLAIPDQILNKSGALTDEEFAIAQQHRRVTVDILNSCFSNKKLVDIVCLSDRWWDGTHGQPSGTAIPEGARLLAIASLFDDVSHGRAWWQPHTTDEAIEVLRRAAGAQLDPQLVQAFAAMLLSEAAVAAEC